MLNIIEQKVTTILRPTSINLAPYVINPYQGCQMGCAFCYARFSRRALKEKIAWGEYVYVKSNGLEVLRDELKAVKPQRVLLGSTTECFQPVERKYRITESILRLLNEQEIPYIILSRSLLIEEYIPVLKQGNCEAIYFTVDTLPEDMRRQLEPYSAAAGESIKTINKLSKNIKVIAYFCPVMPWLFKPQEAIDGLEGIDKAEFEILNFRMSGMDMIMDCLRKLYPELAGNYRRLLKDKDFHEETMNGLKQEVSAAAANKLEDVTVHAHAYEGYFTNRYYAGTTLSD